MIHSLPFLCWTNVHTCISSHSKLRQDLICCFPVKRLLSLVFVWPSPHMLTWTSFRNSTQEPVFNQTSVLTLTWWKYSAPHAIYPGAPCIVVLLHDIVYFVRFIHSISPHGSWPVLALLLSFGGHQLNIHFINLLQLCRTLHSQIAKCSSYALCKFIVIYTCICETDSALAVSDQMIQISHLTTLTTQQNSWIFMNSMWDSPENCHSWVCCDFFGIRLPGPNLCVCISFTCIS